MDGMTRSLCLFENCESLSCTPETSVKLYNYTSIKKKKEPLPRDCSHGTSVLTEHMATYCKAILLVPLVAGCGHIKFSSISVSGSEVHSSLLSPW